MLNAQLQEKQRCSTEYYRNECDPQTRVKALQAYCEERELCMNAPIEQQVGQLQTCMVLVADLVNDFSARLTIQSWLLLVTLTMTITVLMMLLKR